MERVSVIVPIYKVEDYLDQCIASIAGQSYPNLQIILVDDGSPDRCPGMCDDWAKKDPRIIVIHQPNGGLSAARNTGIQKAEGDFILLVDSDDYIAPQTVEVLVCTAEKTDADMVICDYLQGDEREHSFAAADADQVELIDGREALGRIYTDDHHALRYATAWCKLYRRSLFEGIRYPDGKIFEDIYTTHKLLYRCKRIAVISDPLYYYYQRANSIMNASFSLKKLDYLQALVERVEFFAAHDLKELEGIAFDELIHSLLWEYSRTRDVLGSKEGMRYVADIFRSIYRKGYSSRRYPKETAGLLSAFYRNPEWVVWYWRISALLRRLTGRKG